MATLAFTWTDFAQQVVSGLATGSIYASLALAIVIIYRATGVINFAQGEMAMFSTFIAWWLIADPNGPEYHLWIGFTLTLAISFAGGVALERLVIRPVEGAPVLTIVMVTLGLGIALFGLAAWVWGADTKRFPSAFSTRTIDAGGVVFSIQDAGFIAVTFGAVALLWLFFQHTKPDVTAMKPASWIEKTTPPASIVRVENALGKRFVSAPQIHAASPKSAMPRPSVTMTIVSTGAPSTGRMTSRSSAMPPANEMASVRVKPTQRWYPGPLGSAISHQAMNVENIAISPCAKLMTPVAR